MEQNELILLFEETTVNKENDKIPLKFICDSLGIDYEYQIRYTATNPVLQKYMEKVANEELYGDKRQRLSLSKKGFLIFVLGLSASNVPEENREKFYMYQEFIFDYLFDDAMLRESIIKNKLLLTKELKELEAEIQTDERFKRYSSLKDQIKNTDGELKQLNSRLIHKMQGTLNFPE